jgi:hypothetical protein
MSRKDNVFAGDFLSPASYFSFAVGQAPIILTIETKNLVAYQFDTSDVSKYATAPNITPAAPFRNFTPATPQGDIGSVNGEINSPRQSRRGCGGKFPR